ncbi:MAG: hypothetical protein ACN4GZ_01795, partial [Acidimicrobiales bacterium]
MTPPIPELKPARRQDGVNLRDVPVPPPVGSGRTAPNRRRTPAAPVRARTADDRPADVRSGEGDGPSRT